MRMNPDIKARWVAALRSGEYKQGFGSLHYKDADGSDRYCCLGVLSELAVKAGVCHRSNNYSANFMYDQDSVILPYSVQRWAGLDCSTPEVGNEHLSLTYLNDGTKDLGTYNPDVPKIRSHDFREIADLIETYL